MSFSHTEMIDKRVKAKYSKMTLLNKSILRSYSDRIFINSITVHSRLKTRFTVLKIKIFDKIFEIKLNLIDDFFTTVKF